MKRDDLFAGYEQGQRDMLAKCIEALEQMLDVDPCDCDRCRTYTMAQAILRALQEGEK
jgi:hypothetical protein